MIPGALVQTKVSSPVVSRLVWGAEWGRRGRSARGFHREVVGAPRREPSIQRLWAIVNGLVFEPARFLAMCSWLARERGERLPCIRRGAGAQKGATSQPLNVLCFARLPSRFFGNKTKEIQRVDVYN
jgi:hypothetical protein